MDGLTEKQQQIVQNAWIGRRYLITDREIAGLSRANSIKQWSLSAGISSLCFSLGIAISLLLLVQPSRFTFSLACYATGIALTAAILCFALWRMACLQIAGTIGRIYGESHSGRGDD